MQKTSKIAYGSSVPYRRAITLACGLFHCFYLFKCLPQRSLILFVSNCQCQKEQKQFMGRDSCLREWQQTPYLADLISDYVSPRTLRSSTKTLLAESSFRTNIGRRSLRYVAARTCNNIPDDIKTVNSFSLF